MTYSMRATGLFAMLIVTLMLALPGAARAEGLNLINQSNDSAITAGSVLRFKGTGFPPGRFVPIWATDPDGMAIKGDYPNASEENEDDEPKGVVKGRFQVPENAVAGDWVLTARDPESKTEVTLTFKVTNSKARQATKLLKANPKQGTRNQKFTFTALGFSKDQSVTYWFTMPSDLPGGATTDPVEAKADDVGAVEIADWQPPADAPIGHWVFTVQAKSKDATRKRTLAIPFEITK